MSTELLGEKGPSGGCDCGVGAAGHGAKVPAEKGLQEDGAGDGETESAVKAAVAEDPALHDEVDVVHGFANGEGFSVGGVKVRKPKVWPRAKKR